MASDRIVSLRWTDGQLQDLHNTVSDGAQHSIRWCTVWSASVGRWLWMDLRNTASDGAQHSVRRLQSVPDGTVGQLQDCYSQFQTRTVSV